MKHLINYYHNKTNDIILKLLDPATGVVSYQKKQFQNYFFILTEDTDKVKKAFVNFEFRDKFSKLLTRVHFGYEDQGKYTKICYSDTKDVYLFGLIKEIITVLQNNNIKSFEADLMPGDNYVLENNYEIADNYRILYWDIETRDDGGSIEIGRDQIISICAIDNTGKKYYICDDSEEKVLQEFTDILQHYDIIVGWNSKRFDSPYLKARLKLYEIWFSFKALIEIDLMSVFMASFAIKVRQGKEFITSYSLDNISRTFIKDSKIKVSESEGTYGGRLWNLYNTNRQELLDYNMQDCVLLKKLDEEFHLILNEIELSKLCKVPLSKTRSLTGIVDFLLLRAAREDNLHFKTRTWDVEKSEHYEGGYVVPDIPGVYENINIIDFASMYPNITRTCNISPDTVLDTKTDNCIQTPDGTCFSKIPGLVPKVLSKLTTLRLKYKAEQSVLSEQEKTHEALLMEFKQTNVKVLILALYGQLGAPHARWYDVRAAAAITSVGRTLVQTVTKKLENNGFKVIGGDTDSLFLSVDTDINRLKAAEVFNAAISEVVKNTNTDNKHTLEMEYERILSPFVVLAKKKYCGRVISNYDNKKKISIKLHPDKYHIYGKGLEIFQSSQTKKTKQLLQEVIDAVLIKQLSLDEITKIVEKHRKQILNKLIIDKDDLVITKKVARMPETYTGKTKPAHVELAIKRKEMGEFFYTGMRIPYIVTGESPITIVHRDDYVDGQYDEKYYWSTQIWAPTLRFLSVVHPHYYWDKYSSGDIMIQQQLGDYS